MSLTEDPGFDPGRRRLLLGPFLAGSEAMHPPSPGVALLDRGSCLAWNRVLCRSCEVGCPEDAIVFGLRGRPKVDPEACTGCGLCVPLCPSRSLEIAG